MIPTLEASRLLVRPFSWDDFPWFLAAHQDPVIGRYLLYRTPWTEEFARWFFSDLLAHYEQDGMGHMALVRKGDGAIVGRSGLSSWLVEGEVELGYTLPQEHWGKGYATEGSQALRDYGFGVMGLPRLISLIEQGNEPSMAVARRNGFVYERDVEREGGRTFTIWAGTREAWHAGRQP
ncbi:MAG TPA: GNAT family N-acetyltransferase [bacterium]|nr:GNAT family N-acetyltransferase [bacterium]